MEKFFEYDNPFTKSDFYNLTFLEWIIPISLVYTIILVLVIYRVKILEMKSLDMILRYIMGITLAVLFIVHNVLLWLNEVSVNNLPFNFYALSIITCLVLNFTKSRKIYPFVLFSGVIWGMINMLFNQAGYSYQYFRYYQFMISNGLLIIIPLYFLIVHNYIPNIKDLVSSIVGMQVIIIVIFLINYLFDTNFMYLTIGANQALPNTIISYLGKWPWYFIWLELTVITIIFIMYLVINLIYIQMEKNKNKSLNKQ